MTTRKVFALACFLLIFFSACQVQKPEKGQIIGDYNVNFDGSKWLAGVQSRDQFVLESGSRTEMWYIIDYLENHEEFRAKVKKVSVIFDNGSFRDIILLKDAINQVQFVLVFDEKQTPPLVELSSIAYFPTGK